MRAVRHMSNMAWLFVFGAMLGYVWEVALSCVMHGRFVNRGYLHGPWLPIYGVGALLLFGLSRLTGKRRVLFFFSAVAVCGVLEYTVGYLSELVYRMKWWSYDSMPLNLHGRVFAGGLLFFAALGCAVIFGLLPLLKKILSRLPDGVSYTIIGALLIFMAADLCVSAGMPNMGDGITSFVTAPPTFF